MLCQCMLTPTTGLGRIVDFITWLFFYHEKYEKIVQYGHAMWMLTIHVVLSH